MAMGKKALPLVMDISSNQNGIMRMQIDGRNQNGKDNQSGKGQFQLKFPITRAILWNRAQIGKDVTINLSKQRKVRMYISEKTLLLASRHGQSKKSSVQGFLIGDFIIDSGEGVTLQIDRFDPGRCVQIETANGFVDRKVPTAIIPGDHTVSLLLNHSIESFCHSSEFMQSIEVLSNRNSKKSLVNVPDLFMSRASFHCQTDLDELIINFKCNMVTYSTKFNAKPINSVPIIPTALAKNLTGPIRLSHVQGNAKFGFLTMDQARKLLLLLESDPKVESLPLVGIWVSGVMDIYHAYVWACCLKFMQAEYIKERVLAPPSSFLLVHYPTTKTFPDFYECCLKPREYNNMPFQLLKCEEQFVLNAKPGSCDSVCFDLCEADDDNMSVFHDAFQQWLSKKQNRQSQPVLQNSTSGTNPVVTNSCTSQFNINDEDSIPSPKQLPKPHARLNELHPASPYVPELSLLEPHSSEIRTNKPYNPKAYQENLSQHDSSPNLNAENEPNTSKNAEYPTRTVATTMPGNRTQGKVLRRNQETQQNGYTLQNDYQLEKYPGSAKAGTMERRDGRDEGVPDIPGLPLHAGEMDRIEYSERKKIPFEENVLVSKGTPDKALDLSFQVSQEAEQEEGGSFARNEGRFLPLQQINGRNLQENREQHDQHRLHNQQRIQQPHHDKQSEFHEQQQPQIFPRQQQRDKQSLQDQQQQQQVSPEQQQKFHGFLQQHEEQQQNLQQQRQYENGRQLQQQYGTMSQHGDRKPKQPNPLSLIAAHEQQLFELQEQIEQLLEQKRQEDKKSQALQQSKERTYDHKNTSVQCSFLEQRPAMASISVNTGESLLMPTSESAPEQDSQRDSRGCKCCCKYKRSKKPRSPKHSASRNQDTFNVFTPASSRNSTSHLENSSFHNEPCSLSDLQAVDMSLQNLPQNPSATSMQSFVSVLEAVDVPVFEDSQNTEPLSPNELELGESASMIASRNQHKNDFDDFSPMAEEAIASDSRNVEADESAEKEFYEQMVAGVKDLLSDQMENIVSNELCSAANSDSETEEGRESFSDFDRQQQIEQATLQQLKKLGADPLTDTQVAGHVHTDQALVNGTASFHPRINYVSMLATDTTDDANDVADAIAMKYLSTKQLRDVKCSVQEQRTKTVKFEGVLENEFSTPKRGVSYVNMNFSCNMSIATRKYMQRYNLLDAENEGKKDRHKKSKTLARNIREELHNKNNDDIEDKTDNVSSKILDLSKLKNLPKLT